MVMKAMEETRYQMSENKVYSINASGWKVIEAEKCGRTETIIGEDNKMNSVEIWSHFLGSI